MALKLSVSTAFDPDGHKPGLRLQGDWVHVLITDGRHWGVGELSHSGDDARCIQTARELFAVVETSRSLSLELLQAWRVGNWSNPADFITATAISGLEQALVDLIAQQAGVPSWQLFGNPTPPSDVPVYATLNRALTSRTESDYGAVIEAALQAGFTSLKVAPFDQVEPAGDQRAQAREALELMEKLVRRFPAVSWRVDCHARFVPKTFAPVARRLASLSLAWLEEPFVDPTALAALRQACPIPIAAGELFFGPQGFLPLLQANAVDVIMPDVKHCGGFLALREIGELAESFGVKVSPPQPLRARFHHRLVARRGHHAECHRPGDSLLPGSGSNTLPAPDRKRAHEATPPNRLGLRCHPLASLCGLTPSAWPRICQRGCERERAENSSTRSRSGLRNC
jgi:galactonate dehydratase